MIKQLYCNKNNDCTLEVGTVLGSALIYNCKNCKFIVSAHQVRIHKCENCTFSLFAGSSPVIEDSTSLVFQEIDAKLIPTAYQGKQNLCELICDFNWHKKEKSPNWTFVKP